MSPTGAAAAARLARADRVCIVLLSGIGDVVHGLPVAVALKRDRPSRRVVWVAQPAPAQVLEHHSAVDEIVVFRPQAGFGALRSLWSAFQGRPCEVTLNMQRYGKTLFPTYLSGASVRVGLAPSRTRDGVRLINTVHTPEGPWRHTQDLFLEFLDQVGVDRPDPLEWGIAFSDQEEREAADFFAHLGGRPVVGLVLATANPKKDWLPDRYTALADMLEEELGYTVLLLGGPGDTDLGVPVVGLFGHTNPWRVAPYERFHDLIVDRYSDPGETPDPSRYEPRQERMVRITVADVLERVRVAEREYRVGAA